MKKLLIFPDIKTSPSLTGTEFCSCKEIIWQEGRSFSKNEYDFSNLEFICEHYFPGNMTDFAVSDTGAPVISENLKSLFEDMGLALQYYPVKIFLDVKDPPLLNYYVINIISTIDSIDYEASDLDLEEEDGEVVDIIEIGTLVLKKEFMAYIYRLQLFERVIVVEGELADRLQAMNISGMKLIKPECWDGFAGEKS